MMIHEIDQLDDLSDDQLWEVASDTRNLAELRQEAIQRWLFPDEIDPDASPDELGGGRLRDLQERASVTEDDDREDDEDTMQDSGEMGPYFDAEGQLLVRHNGVSYLIDSLDDEGSYDGIDEQDDVYTTDDKTNTDRDL